MRVSVETKRRREKVTGRWGERAEIQDADEVLN
jgi:hypothetical protein